MASEKIPLFALLIGINSYPTAGFPSLRGAVADTLDFQKYLETELAVPSEQIVVLTESNATRKAVTDALAAFGVDSRIAKGDAILIYYAGHGTELDPPTEWKVDGDNDKIQAIVPYDCNSGETVGTVPPIPDHTLEVLLSRIAREKGDNITVIFDCCHSASGTRGSRPVESDMAVRVRSAELASFVCPDDLDEEIVSDGTRSAFVAPKYRMRGLGSHTLLSACGKLEQAREERGHGRFSTSLLRLLRQVSPENLRHSEILGHALFPRIKDQNPQCEGIYKNRTLFNRKVLPAQRKSFAVEQKGGGYGVGAGSIHRITKDSEFTVYRKTDITLSTPLGILVAGYVAPFSSTAQVPIGSPKLDLSEPVIAVIKKLAPHKFCIRIPPDNGFVDIYRELQQSHQGEFDSITLVDGAQSDAHAEISLTEDDRISFKLFTRRNLGGMFDVAENSIDNDLDDLARVLSAAISFYGEFENHHEDQDISKNVHVEVYRLMPVSTHTMGFDGFNGYPLMRPVGHNLCKDGVVKVYVQYPGDEDNTPYGIRVVNKSGGDMYANLFHFNHADLSISPCAMAYDSGHHTLDVSLRQNGSLTIGYGQSGYPPVSFTVAEGLDFEVGFLKVYLTTESVDLSYIQQDTPFVMSRHMVQHKPKPKSAWTDIIIPIIQHREPLPPDLPPDLAQN